ncbi:MAG TPA: sll0787 family AIR synthase-like protein [Polyangiaceae bacterium]|nr:sll0787 family AIR synthase-like protein [Polyangiaceae bacterium]
MKLERGRLRGLTEELRSRAELGMKRDIQIAAKAFGRVTRSSWFPDGGSIVNGDDTAALRSADGYTLFAAEGMRSEFVNADPWFAGFCSVLVNANDVAAMGGRPWAVVDVLFLGDAGAERVLEGIVAASELLGIPVVGGHTTRVPGPTELAVAVLGRARELIRGDGAKPGQKLVAAFDLRGTFRGAGNAFNAATTAPAAKLRAALAVLPELAESGSVRAGKDISMAGTPGTLLMLCESSGVGAKLDLSRLPAPPDVEPLRWLTAFPSFGFLLAVDASVAASVCARFDAVGVTADVVGEITATRHIELRLGDERERYWDLAEAPLTGFAPDDQRGAA